MIRVTERSSGAKRGGGIEPSGRRTGNQRTFYFLFIYAANLLLLSFSVLNRVDQSIKVQRCGQVWRWSRVRGYSIFLYFFMQPTYSRSLFVRQLEWIRAAKYSGGDIHGVGT